MLVSDRKIIFQNPVATLPIQTCINFRKGFVMSKKHHKKSPKCIIPGHKYLQEWINENIENPIPRFDFKVNHKYVTNPEITKASVKDFGFDHQDTRDVGNAMIDLLAERVILSGEINKSELEKTPTQRFNEMSQAGLDDDAAMAVTTRQMREVTDHNEMIRLFEQWYSQDTDQAIIDTLPTRIWVLWTQIQGNYATW